MNNINVAIKVRPMIKRELKEKLSEQWRISGNSIHSISLLYPHSYNFDHIFGPESNNNDVFEQIAEPIVHLCLEGFNGTIFAYGQTSSGKTHTMMGDDDDPGITRLAIRKLFQGNHASSNRVYMIRVGYIEIYNDKVYDLLTDRKLVNINQDGDCDVKLSNKEVLVNTEEMIMKIINQGDAIRKTALTKMNESSSRSHAIFRVIIESEDKVDGNGAVQISYLNLVDLAGSERANDAGTSGCRLKEGGHINTSLLFLSQVMRELNDGEKYINYRSTKLTRILQASLGGNANTAIICNVTPAVLEETASTLSFASNAKNVKNVPVCNKVYTEEAFMKQMQVEIEYLKAQLKSKDEQINREKLEAEIAQKEATFLAGINMRPKTDRRKTWHYTGSSLTLPLPANGVSSHFGISANGLANAAPIRDIKTPKILKYRECLTPETPNTDKTKYKLGVLEDEFTELQQFTALEKDFEATKDTDIVKNLQLQLKIAQDQLHVQSADQWKMVHEKLEQYLKPDSNGMDKLPESNVDVGEENLKFIKQLEEVQSAHKTEIVNLEQQLKRAKLSQEKAVVLQAEGEITFNQYKSQSDRRIQELINEVEDLKVRTNVKSVDLNISKMPIKAEPSNSYELTELKSDLDQLKVADVRNKKLIEELETKLTAVLEERNVLQTEHSDLSSQLMEYLEDMEQMKTKLETIENENVALKTQLTEINTTKDQDDVESHKHEAKVCQMINEITHLKEQNDFLSTKLVTLEPLKAKNDILTSSYEKTETDNKKLVKQLEDLTIEYESLKQSLETTQTDLNARIDQYQSQLDDSDAALKEMTVNYSTSQQTIDELKDEVKKLQQALMMEENLCERNILSPPDNLYADLKARKDAYEKLEVTYENLKRMYDATCDDTEKLRAITDEHLQVIEKTEEECRTFKASLLESYDKIKISMEETESLKVQNASLSAEVSNLKNLLDTQTFKVTDLITKLDELQQQNSIISAKSENEENLQDELQKLQQKHRSEIAEKEDALKKLTDQFQSNIQQLRTAAHEQERISKDNSIAFQDEIAKLKSELDSKKQHEEDLQSVISKSKSELERQTSELQGEITRLKSELDSKAHLSNDLQSIVSKSKSELEQQTSDLQAEITKLKSELDAQTQQSDELQSVVSKSKSELEQQTSDLQAEITKLKSELDAKTQQSDELQSVVLKSKSELEQQTSDLQEEITKLKSELDANTQQSDTFQTAVSKLKSEWEQRNSESQGKIKQLRSESDSKTRQLDDLQSIVTNLKSELQQHTSKSQGEIEKLKMDFDCKAQQSHDLQSEISKLRFELDGQTSELQDEITQLKSEMDNKQRQSDDFQVSLLKLKSELEQQTSKSHGEIKKLKVELDLKEQQSKDLQSAVSKLKSELEMQTSNAQEAMEKFKSEMELKKQQANAEKSKFKSELLSMQQQSDAFKDENLQLKIDLQDLLARLENQSRLSNGKCHESDEQKKSPKSKGVIPIDRKARRYSQHDESRLSLDETIIPPKSVPTQTDPSDENCSCIPMNLKIQELERTVKIKECVIKTQKMQIDNHPLLSENDDLKRKLHDKQMEMKTLQLDVEHYKAKVQHAQNYRECLCRSREFASKEVQVGCDKNLKTAEEDLASSVDVVTHYRLNILPDKYDAALRDLEILRRELDKKSRSPEVLSNGHPPAPTFARSNRQTPSNGQAPSNCSSSDNLESENLPTSTTPSLMEINKLKREITKLKKEKEEILKTTKVYRHLSVQRRERILALEKEMNGMPNGQQNATLPSPPKSN